MALRDLLKFPLDRTDPNADAFMRSVQGNILKGHGRHHAAHVFVTFGSDVSAGRRWIAGSMLHRLTAAGGQAAQTKSWKAVRDYGDAFFAFFLSRDGYTTLGLADAQIPADPYFRAGMKSAPAGVSPTVADPPVTQWEANFQRRIDAMALVAHADPSRIDPLSKMLVDELTALGARVFVERGDQQTFDFPGRKNVEIEHFGHQDGISQPLMVKQEAEEETAERGSANWNPIAPLQLGFVEEPGQADTFGSYLVFRKLQQNVLAFRSARDGLAGALKVDIETAAALAVGRFRDGRPVIPTDVLKAGADPNDFSFNQDPNAASCPYQAHIRKTNPRGDIVRILKQTEAFERSKRILRRGITYGMRPDLQPGSTLPAPKTGVGLLFMSYQAELNQFVIQQDGSDSNDFVKQNTGPDSVLGVNATALPQQWPVNGVPAVTPFLMSNFITMLGGEYFFAPSPAFLASL